MTDINVVSVIGRLTKDAEVKTSQDGKNAWGTISIAVSERVRNGEKWEDRASYFEVKAGGPNYKSLAQYLTKGRQVAISGSLVQDRWEKNGQNYSMVRIRANSIELLQEPKNAAAPASAPAPQPKPAQTGNGPENFQDSDFDDLPAF